MIKTISIADIQLDNYSAKEAVMKLEQFWDEPVLHVVEEIPMELLIKAQSETAIKTFIQQMDLTVIADEQILKLADVSDPRREREIREHHFFYEVLKRLERNHKRLFLVGQSENKVEQLRELIQEEFHKCQIVGVEAIENCNGAIDGIINEINAATVDVILSVIPVPQQESFLMENKEKISAKLWYGIGSEAMDKSKRGIGSWFRKHSHRRKLEEHIANFEETDQV